jgi:hypothetical protein
MENKVLQFQNLNYTIRPFNAVDNVIIFHVLKPSITTTALDLAVMYGWVDKKLVELTPRTNENSLLMETFHKFILSNYRLN